MSGENNKLKRIGDIPNVTQFMSTYFDKSKLNLSLFMLLDSLNKDEITKSLYNSSYNISSNILSHFTFTPNISDLECKDLCSSYDSNILYSNITTDSGNNTCICLNKNIEDDSYKTYTRFNNNYIPTLDI